jgi:hypothetical protein
MRKILMLVAVLTIFTSLTEAQESYTIPASAPNVASLTVVVTGHNGDVCERYSQPRTCNQAQACTAAETPGGASCTPAQARAAGVRIFALTQAGREEYTIHMIVLPKFLELLAAERAEQHRAYCVKWLALTQTQRNTFCTGTLGEPASCGPTCP